VDIIAFHWPLLVLVCFVCLVSGDLVNLNPWAILILGLIMLGFIPAYLYAAIRVFKFEQHPFKRFGWCALFLGLWPIGGPVCYWLFLRKRVYGAA